MAKTTTGAVVTVNPTPVKATSAKTPAKTATPVYPQQVERTYPSKFNVSRVFMKTIGVTMNKQFAQELLSLLAEFRPDEKSNAMLAFEDQLGDRIDFIDNPPQFNRDDEVTGERV